MSKEVKIYTPREGLLSFTRCPDCKQVLVRMVKMNEFGADFKNTGAVVCRNHQCWRYTETSMLTTWKRC